MAVRHHERGFTLVELLIALAVLGLVMLALGEAFSYATRALQSERARLAAGSELEPTDRFLRALLAQQALGEFNGTATELRFHGMLPKAVPASERRARITLALDKAHRLILRYRQDDLPGDTPFQDVAIVEGVAGLDFAYQHAPATPWAAVHSGVPALIRVRVSFNPGDARRWPDLLIAPSLR